MIDSKKKKSANVIDKERHKRVGLVEETGKNKNKGKETLMIEPLRQDGLLF